MARLKTALLGISAIAMTFSTAAIAQDEGGADVFAARQAARAERQEQRAQRQAPVREQGSEARASWGEARAARQQEARQAPREQRMEARAENRAERQERRSARQDGVGYTSRSDAILARQGANRAADDARREAYEQSRRAEAARREANERNRSYTDRNRDPGYGYGSRNDARRDRHRDWDRSAWRNDRRYDWRHWRERNRSTFHVGVYYSPYRDYRYRRLGVGHILQSMFFGQRYIINDPWRYRLPEVYGPYRWVRYYDDVMLVDVYNGRVVDVIHDFFW